jgi:hypothetical protein
MRALLVKRNKAKDAAQAKEDGTIVNNNEHAFEVSGIAISHVGRGLMSSGLDRP